MEKGIKKISYKVLTLVLCLCIVSGAAAPAYADDSTSGYSYYRAGSTLNPYTQQSGKNSADMIGRLLDVSSYNQSMIYNRLLQMSTSGSDLTTVNSYITAIDSKLGVIRDSLGIGSSLENVLSNQTSNLQHLNTIINKLSYWDNSHGRSYDLSEMIFSLMSNSDKIYDNTETIVSNVAIQTNYQNVIRQNVASYLQPIYTNISGVYNILNSAPQRSSTYISRPVLGNTFSTSTIPNSNIFNTSVSTANNGATVMNSFNGLSNVADMIASLHVDLLQVNQRLTTLGTVYNVRLTNRDLSLSSWVALSVSDILLGGFHNLSSHLGALSYVLADDKTIAAKQANQDNEDTVLDNFTGSGSASATPSDFGAVKDSMVDLKAGFTGGASSSDTFSFLSGDSNAWDWFTQDTANDLDRTQRSNTRLLRSSSDVASDTPLLDSYYTSILSILGGDE